MYQFTQYFAYLRGAGSFAGLLALIGAVFFMGPMISIEGYRPLDSLVVRLVIIAILLVGLSVFYAFRWVRRRFAARSLAKEMSRSSGGDGDVLSKRMKEALDTLQKARGTKGDYLYAIPWYLIIGPPGAGKTTALLNSGLKFPLSQTGDRAMIEGTGGTRYCDWWFTDKAVLIDTAGRYTTQDSAAEPLPFEDTSRGDANAQEEPADGTSKDAPENLDKTSWLAFLDILRAKRPRQPINGVIVAVSLHDLMQLTDREKALHADAIRSRLIELYEHLGVVFPVYVMFTKTDLLAGFDAFFSDLRESDRRMVWGATFKAERGENTVGQVGLEYDALVERLSELVPDRLQAEPNPSRRAAIFGFPAQMTAIKGEVNGFLHRIFEPTRYQVEAVLRGFYFTSGTQEGTAIDRLIGASARATGSDAQGSRVSGQMSGKGRSYFLHDLLDKVIFGEAGWVSVNRKVARRMAIMRTATYGAIAAVAVLTLTLWGVSYAENARLLSRNEEAIDTYRIAAVPILAETEISDANLSRVLQLLLHPLRHLPIGYDGRNAGVPLTEGFGLSQRGRVLSAAEEAYRRALERTLRPRLILRMEEQIEARIDDPAFVYEALKVYLMLGGDPRAKAEDDLIVSWMRRDWEQNLYPGPQNRQGRDGLEGHLRAMLELDDGETPLVSLNAPMIEDAQRTLARMTVADRAFALLKSEAIAMGLPAWRLIEQAGPDTNLVFETRNATDIASVGVSSLFTYEGFHRGFMSKLGGIAERIEAEQWVLGDAGAQVAVTAQYDTLIPDVVRLYELNFIEAWEDMLGEIALRPMTGDQRYTALRALSSPTSPLEQFLLSLREETTLTRDPPPEMLLAEATDGDRAEVIDAAAPALFDPGRRQRLQELGEPGARVESHFFRLQELVDPSKETTVADELVAQLANIYDSLVTIANSPTRAEREGEALAEAITDLRTASTRLPDPISRLIGDVADDVQLTVANATIAQLSQSFENEVTRACERVVANRYPFYAQSERDVPLVDFARLFRPGGLIDAFRQANLDALIDQSAADWTWRGTGDGAEPEFSINTLRQFQRAAEIRDAFFSLSDELPQIGLTARPLRLDADAKKAVLKINKTLVDMRQQGANSSVRVIWPGPDPDNHAAVAVTIGEMEQPAIIEETGTWSFFRLLDKASRLKQGDRLNVTFTVKGQQVSYELSSDTLNNPLTLEALREFKCPSGL